MPTISFPLDGLSSHLISSVSNAERVPEKEEMTINFLDAIRHQKYHMRCELDYQFGKARGRRKAQLAIFQKKMVKIFGDMPKNILETSN